ncbi:hypothetical protein LPJ63_001671 [Coemansia sp. RSA 2711]|nr:hypothetical protein LPJ63_001671 [Coemansia sp. RSA 2711]KAJ2309862.1 hypothetical protein IWW54_003506 [Coemansia sp. RSA 2705]
MVDKGKQADTSVEAPDPQTAFGAVMPVIADLLERGTRAFALGNWEAAIEQFGELSSITEETFGSESQRYADCLVMYGRALLQHAIEQSALLAQKTLAEAASGTLNKESEEKDEGEAQSSKANIQFEGEPDFRQVEEQDSGVEGVAEGKEEEEEEEDDFAAAWNVLDLARVIQEKATDKKSQLKYAETLMLLGDVSMESENFAQAVKDFDAALLVKQQFLGDDDRELAEIFYKVALAYEYNQDNQRALELMGDVQRILGNRLKHLEASEATEDQEEAQSLQEVLADVASKIDEWKSPPKPVDLNALSESEQLLADKAKEMLKQAMEAGTINDISSLVKKRDPESKRKPEGDDSEVKRIKSDDAGQA